MDFEDIGWDSTDWIHVAHDKDYWQALAGSSSSTSSSILYK